MPEEYDLVVRNARLHSKPGGRVFDVGIGGGRISKISDHIAKKS